MMCSTATTLTNTHSQHVFFITRTEVSLEATTGAVATCAAITVAAAVSGAVARARMLLIAPDLWQVCLAHLLRDAQYAIDCGDDAFSVAFKRLLLRSIAIGRRREALQDTTLRQHRADLDRRLDRVLALPRRGETAEKLRRRIARNREPLFVFVWSVRWPWRC